MILPKGLEAELGEDLKIMEVFSWYDFPRLFEVKSNSREWLGLWINNLPNYEGDEWYYLKLNHWLMLQLLNKKIDIRTSFLCTQDIFSDKWKPIENPKVLKITTRHKGLDSAEEVDINPNVLSKAGIYLKRLES